MKKIKFNIFAGLFGRLWFASHFLFLELAIISIIDLLVCTIMQLMIIYTYYDHLKIAIVSIRVGLLLMLPRFVMFGFLGSLLLERNHQRVNRKMESGIFCMIEYLRCYEKAVVFRGASVFLFGCLQLIINLTIFPMIIDFIVY